LNYVGEFIPNLNQIIKPLHERLKKNPSPWTDNHSRVIVQVKSLVKSLPCLYLPNPQAPKIVETDAFDLGYGGILKQKINNVEHVIAFTSKPWNTAQLNYSTIKRKF